MKSLAVTIAALGACAKPAHHDAPPALADLSLDAARADFNAHTGEARFLTLLSPT